MTRNRQKKRRPPAAKLEVASPGRSPITIGLGIVLITALAIASY